MRAVIAAGGTAGHINPAIAIANEIMRDEPASKVLFVGRQDGMEAELVPAAGYDFKHIEIHGFDRVFTLAALWFNIKCVYYAVRATVIARRLFCQFKPDIVIGCGGYISGPVVRTATKMGIKTAVQEQNAFPGMTTRMLAKRVDIVFVPGRDALAYMPDREKCIVAGNPIRAEFLQADRDDIRRRWTIGDKTCVVSFGGSLGARTINEVAVCFMKLHGGTGKVCHIHATGQYGTQLVPDLMKQQRVDDRDGNIRIVEYIDDMPECFAAADLVLSRAGAITISELSATGKASVLIPSPNVAGNHQYYNALTLQNIDAALVFEEKDLDAHAIAQMMWTLAQDKPRLKKMGQNAKQIAVPDSARIIYEHLKALVAKREDAR